MFPGNSDRTFCVKGRMFLRKPFLVAKNRVCKLGLVSMFSLSILWELSLGIISVKYLPTSKLLCKPEKMTSKWRKNCRNKVDCHHCTAFSITKLLIILRPYSQGGRITIVLGLLKGCHMSYFFMDNAGRVTIHSPSCDLGDLRTVLTKYEGFSARLGPCRKSRSLQGLLGSTKKTGVATHFFWDN